MENKQINHAGCGQVFLGSSRDTWSLPLTLALISKQLTGSCLVSSCALLCYEKLEWNIRRVCFRFRLIKFLDLWFDLADFSAQLPAVLRQFIRIRARLTFIYPENSNRNCKIYNFVRKSALSEGKESRLIDVYITARPLSKSWVNLASWTLFTLRLVTFGGSNKENIWKTRGNPWTSTTNAKSHEWKFFHRTKTKVSSQS